MKIMTAKQWLCQVALWVLALLLVFGLCGCADIGAGETTPDTVPNEITSAETSSPQTQPQTSPSETILQTTYPIATVPSAASSAEQTTLTDSVPTQTLRPTKCRYEHTYDPVPCTAHSIACTLCGYETDLGAYSMLRIHQYVDGVCTECREREEHAGLQFVLDRYHIGEERFYSVCGIGSYASSHLTLPETYCGLPVKKIYRRAFQNTEIESVEIPANIEIIDDEAFSCAKKLSRVVIREGVQRTGSMAFEDCISLTEITLPSSVTQMGSYIFWRCKALKTVICSEGMTEIGAGAFADCIALTEISLADSIVYIEDRAFQNCTALKSVTLPASYGTKKQDGFALFEGCTSLTSVIFKEGCLAVSTQMFKDCTNLSSVSLPQSLKEIYSGAFEGCENLTSVIYRGTRAEWMNVSIRSRYLKCDIVCRDGTLTLETMEAYFS